MDNEFDPMNDEVIEETGDDECPSCGIVTSIDGTTPGCYDPNGCGEDVEDFDEEDAMEVEEDDEVDELDFS